MSMHKKGKSSSHGSYERGEKVKPKAKMRESGARTISETVRGGSNGWKRPGRSPRDFSEDPYASYPMHR